jgi:hypothetical protein
MRTRPIVPLLVGGNAEEAVGTNLDDDLSGGQTIIELAWYIACRCWFYEEDERKDTQQVHGALRTALVGRRRGRGVPDLSKAECLHQSILSASSTSSASSCLLRLGSCSLVDPCTMYDQDRYRIHS